MGSPFRTSNNSPNKKDFQKKLNDRLSDIEDEISDTNSRINGLYEYMDIDLKHVDYDDELRIESEDYLRKCIQNRLRCRYQDDPVGDYILGYIDENINIKDQKTDVAKRKILDKYTDFIGNIINELESYRDDIINKRDKIEQIKYKKERAENTSKVEFEEQSFDIPNISGELDEKLEKVTEDEDDENDKYMAVDEFIIFVEVQLKKINDLDYRYEDYQVYRERYPEKTEIIRDCLREEKIDYMCKDINGIPPLTKSQIERLKVIIDMINNGDIRNANKYVQDII